jgi:hypothetical protein
LEGFKSELSLAGVKIPCAVISGAKGIQRVLTENGITYAILGERSGASKRLKKAASEEGALLPLFVAPSQLKPFISKELEDGPLKPIDYQDGDRVVRGYDAAVLVVVCNVWLSARQAGALQTQHLPKAQKAGLLTRALAETGIVALVDEATGYEKVRPQNALGWPWPGMGKNRYSVVAYYTRYLVYERLGPGLLKRAGKQEPQEWGRLPGEPASPMADRGCGRPSPRPAFALAGDAAEARPCQWARLASLPEFGQSGASEARRDTRRAS